jgi:hypothetical protein
MKSIALTQGKVALVDDADFEWLNQWKWYAYQNRQTYYAARQETVSKGKQRMVKMHRVILELEDDNPTHVDHINHDGLDNQRSNIRIASVQQNALNRTDSKGVYWHKQDERWIAQVEVSGKHFHIGSFDTEEEATYARSKVMPIVNHLIEQLAAANRKGEDVTVAGMAACGSLMKENDELKRQLAAAQAALVQKITELEGRLSKYEQS